MFSAPTLVDNKDRALVKLEENPSLDLSADLKRLAQPDPTPNNVPGEGRGEEDSAGVGEWANARGGEEEMSRTVDILRMHVNAHWDRVSDVQKGCWQ